MGRAHEKWHICKCLIFHAKNLLKVYTQKNSGYTKSRRKIRQQKIPKIDSKFLHIELLSREAWTSKDTRFLTLSPSQPTPRRSLEGIFLILFTFPNTLSAHPPYPASPRADPGRCGQNGRKRQSACRWGGANPAS